MKCSVQTRNWFERQDLTVTQTGLKKSSINRELLIRNEERNRGGGGYFEFKSVKSDDISNTSNAHFVGKSVRIPPELFQFSTIYPAGFFSNFSVS